MVIMTGGGSRAAARLRLLDFDHFAAFIFAAMRADAMRNGWLMTLGAFRHGGLLEKIVRAARASTALRVSTLRIGHVVVFSLLLALACQIAQSLPPLIDFLDAAPALFYVAVTPADRADPLTAGPADMLHREAQQNLFPDYIRQF
jgi:hypothetical protein